jgi:hypothetical protein
MFIKQEAEEKANEISMSAEEVRYPAPLLRFVFKDIVSSS